MVLIQLLVSTTHHKHTTTTTIVPVLEVSVQTQRTEQVHSDIQTTYHGVKGGEALPHVSCSMVSPHVYACTQT